jgi:cobalt/nickel transport system permease protein
MGRVFAMSHAIVPDLSAVRPGHRHFIASCSPLQTIGNKVRRVHAPDGFIDVPTSAVLGLVAAGGIAVSIRRAGQVMDERSVPMAGLTSAFVFAAQMVNFPVAGGTSGHLLGGVLAGVLVGPWLGALCVSVVLIVQALLFADGGLTALGLNVFTMALVSTWGGYGLFLGVRRLLPKRPASITIAAGIAASLGVVLASMAFSLAYAVGGTGDAAIGTVTASMIGVHVLIGIGEGVITGLTVGAVMASRPDLVWGARYLRPTGIEATRLQAAAP